MGWRYGNEYETLPLEKDEPRERKALREQLRRHKLTMDGELTGLDSDYTKYGATGSEGVQHVGLLLPNPYGLYDMLGLGFELCNDWYVEGDAYAKEGVLQIDPKGPANDGNNKHVLHAAAWVYDDTYQRSCARSSGQTYTHTGSGSSGLYGIYRLVCEVDMR